MNIPTRRKDGTSRLIKVLAMLILPVLVVAIVACDNGGNSGNSGSSGSSSTTTSAQPYANAPEGKPPALGKPVPDPATRLETKPASELPSFLSEAGPTLQDKITNQYKGAVANYDAYSHIPCYCGCAVYEHAHMSLAECFIQKKNDDGTVTFTDHSMSCDICQGIAQMTIDGIAANKPVKDIRTEVFNKYKYTQIWTDTPPAP